MNFLSLVMLVWAVAACVASPPQDCTPGARETRPECADLDARCTASGGAPEPAYCFEEPNDGWAHWKCGDCRRPRP